MKKRKRWGCILAVFLCAALFTAGVLRPIQAAPLVVEQAGDCYFVAMDGSDTSGDGSLAHPYATLGHVIQELTDNVNEHQKTIYLRGGTYEINKAIDLNFTIKDLTIASYPGEKVVLTASQNISSNAFSPVSGKMRDLLPENAQDQVVVADLSALGLSLSDFPELVQGNNPMGNQPLLSDGDQECQLASYPNGEYSWEWIQSNGNNPYEITCDDRVGSWTYETDQIFGYGFFNLFYILEGFQVESINSKTNTVRFPTTVNGTPVYPFAHYPEWDRWIKFINVYQGLDKPGEYYVDRATQKLYYYPHTAIDEIQLSLSGTILGEGEVVSSAFSLYQSDSVTFRDLTFQSMNNAINADGADDLVVDNCTFSNISVNGINITGGLRTIVRDNLFHDIGSSALWISGDATNPQLTSENRLITNNEFYRIGTISRVYSPAIGLQGIGNTVSNNVIHDLPHAAITFTGANNVISGNDIYQVCQDCGDAAAIYSATNLWSMGTVIENNHIHDNANTAGQYGRITRGIYLDDMVSGVTIRNNVLGPNAGSESAIFVHAGVHNTIEDNVFIDTAFSGSSQEYSTEKAAYLSHWNNKTWRDAVNEHLNSTSADYGEWMPKRNGQYTAWYTAFPWLSTLENAYESDTSMADVFRNNVCIYTDTTAPEEITSVAGPTEWSQTFEDPSDGVDGNGDPYPCNHDFLNKSENLLLANGTPYVTNETQPNGHSHKVLSSQGYTEIRQDISTFPNIGEISKGTHNITIDPSVPAGFLTPSVSQASPGETCTLSLSGNAQVRLVEGTLTANGQKLSLISGMYYFQMPDEDVTITGDFSSSSQTNPLDRLEITQSPDKKHYQAGESFDPAGMTVKAIYTNGTIQPVTDYTINPAGPLEQGTTQITLTYEEGEVTRTATQSITVSAAVPVLTSITVDTPPAKTTYLSGERFDRSGMVVTAHYADGSSKAVTDYSVNQGVLWDNELGYVDAQVRYWENSITAVTTQRVNVLVEFPVPWNLTVTKSPDKTVYKKGELFDPTGMGIELSWREDDNWETPVRVDTIDPADCTFDMWQDPDDPESWYYTVNYIHLDPYYSLFSLEYDDLHRITIQDPPANAEILKTITSPNDLQNIPNGTAATVSALGLPGSVTITTSTGTKQAEVQWLIEESNYDPAKTEAQTFLVNGVLTLPDQVLNPDNVGTWYHNLRDCVRTQIKVAVLAAGGEGETETTTEGGTSETGNTTEQSTTETGNTTEQSTSVTETTTERDTSETANTTERNTSETGITTEQGTSETANTTEQGTSVTETTTERGTSETGNTTEQGTSETETTTERGTSETANTTEQDTSETETTTERSTSETANTTEQNTSETGITTEQGTSETANTTERNTSETETTTERGTSETANTTEQDTSETETTTERGTSETGNTTEQGTSETENTTERGTSETANTTERNTSETETTTERDTSETGITTEQGTSETENTTERNTTATGTTTEQGNSETEASTERGTSGTGNTTEWRTSETGITTEWSTSETGATTERNTTEVGPTTERGTSETETTTEQDTSETEYTTERGTSETGNTTERNTSAMGTTTEQGSTAAGTTSERGTPETEATTERSTTEINTTTEQGTSEMETTTKRGTSATGTTTERVTSETKTTERITSATGNTTERGTHETENTTKRGTAATGNTTERDTFETEITERNTLVTGTTSERITTKRDTINGTTETTSNESTDKVIESTSNASADRTTESFSSSSTDKTTGVSSSSSTNKDTAPSSEISNNKTTEFSLDVPTNNSMGVSSDNSSNSSPGVSSGNPSNSSPGASSGNSSNSSPGVSSGNSVNSSPSVSPDTSSTNSAGASSPQTNDHSLYFFIILIYTISITSLVIIVMRKLNCR